MHNEEKRFGRAIKWGMVGGGRGSQIGYIHRSSAQRDNVFKLIAGAFDINAEYGLEFGRNIGIAEDRCYPDYRTMFAKEAQRKDGIEAVSIATPNNTHYEICKAALEANLHVICEKPLCFTTEQGVELKNLANQKNKVLGVTYGYSGAQMIHQARRMIKNGDLGEIRIIHMQFAHGFHFEEVEAADPGTKWRVTPQTAGASYVIGDLGTHTYYISQLMVPELKIKELMCTRQSFVKSRSPLEDNAYIVMHYENGAVGSLWLSAVNTGSMHQQKIRIVGSKASIEWWDEHPNQLRYEVQGKPVQIFERGMQYLYTEDDMVSCDRIGAGHAEGLFEAWSNIYYRFGKAMHAKNNHDTGTLAKLWYPNVDDGIDGVRFIENCVRSSDNSSQWVEFK